MESTVASKSRKPCCAECKKKLSLAETCMKCPCGGIFCDMHRSASAHCCPVDYRARGSEVLKRSLLKVVAQQVSEI